MRHRPIDNLVAVSIEVSPTNLETRVELLDLSIYRHPLLNQEPMQDTVPLEADTDSLPGIVPLENLTFTRLQNKSIRFANPD
tara:strand:+ start:1510 stop:1755 length:246 start_codon:yes stop_codon:yes gene_type:complete